jgi:hypothetical protein
MDWFPEESYWTGFRVASIGLSEEHRGTDSVTALGRWRTLEVADEQCWLVRRGSDGRVFCAESQPDVVVWRRHVVDIQTEKEGENYSFLIHASLHTTTNECVWIEGRIEHQIIHAGKKYLFKVEEKLQTASLYKRPSTHTILQVLATSGKTAPVSLFSPKSQDILSTRRASSRTVLYLGLKPNCSWRRSPRPLISLRILVSRIFANSMSIVSNRLTGR